VLSTLIGSKRKKEIQDQISNYEIIDVLNKYLEYLEWGNIFVENDRPYFDLNEVNFSDDSAYHGKGCKCDSDAALKIQFLRLIYSYCSRDDSNINNKFNLISSSDLKRIFQNNYLTLFYFYFFKNYQKFMDNESIKFNQNFHRMKILVKKYFHSYFVKNSFIGDYNFNEEYDDKMQFMIINQLNLDNLSNFIDYFNKNYDSVGLLMKLILKYIQECHYSSSKFWLASCIEVMIRGNNTFFQYFISTNTGLIPYLIYDIIYTKNDEAQILQLSFDILGELIKFNRANFMLLNYYFIDQNEFKMFTKKIIDQKYLIDSNVFLRSVIISIYKFNIEDDSLPTSSQNRQIFTSNCKICCFVDKNLTTIFNSLIKIVKPDDINQTNISCINTALLILIMNKIKGKLGSFLQVIFYLI
jgi:hypothetical protein